MKCYSLLSRLFPMRISVQDSCWSGLLFLAVPVTRRYQLDLGAGPVSLLPLDMPYFQQYTIDDFCESCRMTAFSSGGNSSDHMLP